MSIYAAYLYDSLKLYARALDQVIRDQPDQSIEELARNGSLIIDTIIKNHTYQSKYINCLINLIDIDRINLKWFV